MRWLADENFNGHIVDALRRRKPSLDILRVQDTEVSGADDPTVLEWASREGRVMLSHDLKTLAAYANQGVSLGQHLAGLVECAWRVPVRVAVEDILTMEECSQHSEWDNRVTYLPL